MNNNENMNAGLANEQAQGNLMMDKACCSVGQACNADQACKGPCKETPQNSSSKLMTHRHSPFSTILAATTTIPYSEDGATGARQRALNGIGI
ncbi:hypothetical protein PIB30_044888 [Stylosanthes scabra]|uniref:Uncharacterized protein n=1 Tax=Stylosanthes scabra TaxID=79078 RepID=A0ABU6TGN8_9FABA|nr:hypothetical protein [Stylosanthes scabra]